MWLYPRVVLYLTTVLLVKSKFNGRDAWELGPKTPLRDALMNGRTEIQTVVNEAKPNAHNHTGFF